MLGSSQWMQQTQGRISLKDKIYLLQKTFTPTVSHLLHQFGLYKDKPLHLDYDAIYIPDTLLVKAAIEQLEETQNIAVIHHSWRSYFWGISFSQIYQWQYDAEAFLISALLHDIGLIHQSKSESCQCFTLNSAMHAQLLCQQYHYPQDKIALIADAICMHMNGFSEPNQPKEVLMLQKGTSCDVIGADLRLIPSAYQQRCLNYYPRKGFNSIFQALIQKEREIHPPFKDSFFKYVRPEQTYSVQFL